MQKTREHQEPSNETHIKLSLKNIQPILNGEIRTVGVKPGRWQELRNLKEGLVSAWGNRWQFWEGIIFEEIGDVTRIPWEPDGEENKGNTQKKWIIHRNERQSQNQRTAYIYFLPNSQNRPSIGAGGLAQQGAAFCSVNTRGHSRTKTGQTQIQLL